MDNHKETLEGYLIDIACIRTSPVAKLPERAKEHTKACALMGHCMESGYGLVNKQGKLAILDDEATPKIAALLQSTESEKGIWLQVECFEKDGKMETLSVREKNAPQ